MSTQDHGFSRRFVAFLTRQHPGIIKAACGHHCLASPAMAGFVAQATNTGTWSNDQVHRIARKARRAALR